MRIATCLLMMVMALAGCKRDDHTQPKGKPQAKAADGEKKEVAQNQPPPVPPQVNPLAKKEPNPPPGKQGGKNIIQNVRGRVNRAEKENDLHQLRTLYIAFCDSTPKSARTLDNFLADLKTAGNLQQYVKDGFYQVNMKADHTAGESIIAYERDIDSFGYLCVKGNNFVGYVSEKDLKAAIGNP